ncbi:hypothetical protein MKZ38_002799 [Zalerion maritima]|uniref:Uncharacterized protein n=1 Tax=Zalerion maritima TaxID=339359 RepID=A0AAD5WS73_9PEZI|nr:hypothetical protein MKZ38_002799 [Zalerion maritima]
MKLTILFSASLLSTATGAAIQQPKPRETYPLGFEACTETNWTGFCKHYEDVVEGQCYSLVEDFAGKGGISSVRVDEHSYCHMYPNDHCDPGSGNDDDELNVRGSYWDLGYPEIFWDGKPQSFSCEEGY